MARSYSAGEGSISSSLREKAAKIEASAARRAAKVRDEAVAAEAREKVENLVSSIKTDLSAMDTSKIKSEYGKEYPEDTIAFKIPEFKNGEKTKYIDEIWDTSITGRQVPYSINPANGKLYDGDKLRIAEKIAKGLVGDKQDKDSEAQRGVLVKEMVDGGVIDKMVEPFGTKAMEKFYTNLENLKAFQKEINKIPEFVKNHMKTVISSVSTRDYDGDNAIASAVEEKELSMMYEKIRAAAPMLQKIVDGETSFGGSNEKINRQIEEIQYTISMVKDIVNSIKPIQTTRWSSNEKAVIKPKRLDLE